MEPVNISRSNDRGIAPTRKQLSVGKRLGSLVTLLFLSLGGIALALALIMALQFRLIPFPGFFVEQTLIVSNISGRGWNGREQGLNYPMQVTHLNGTVVQNQAEFTKFFNERNNGEAITVQVVTPSGEVRLFDRVVLTPFPRVDFLRLFWLPFLTGLIYLILGVGIFWLRGRTPEGRAFAYFTANASLANILLFDLWSTHVGSLIWGFAIAQIGGAIIALSVLLPKPIPSKAGARWAAFLAYAISFGLGIWGVLTIDDLQNPLAYVLPWQISYLYAFFGLVFFIFSMIIRLRLDLPPLARQQVRIILSGAVIAFTPIGVWFALQLFMDAPFNPLFLSVLLWIFPASIAMAILRYHLWDFDLAFRRTLIYTALTVFLVILYLLLVFGLGSLVDRALGVGNLFNVLATMTIVLIFTPFRKFVQRWIDRLFYQKRLKALLAVRTFQEKQRVQVDLEEYHQNLQSVITETLDPAFVLFWTPRSGHQKGEKDV